MSITNDVQITSEQPPKALKREQQELLHAFFEKSLVSQLLIDQSDGAIRDANPAAVHFYGYSRHHIKTLKITDISILSPSQVHAAMSDAANARRNYFNFQHCLADGDIRDVEVHFSPIQIGSRILLHSIIHDVTDRKQAEETLLRKEKLYRALMENSTDGIKLIDREGKILNANRAACDMLGYTRSELLSLKIPDFDPAWSMERFTRFWDQRPTEDISVIETLHRHKSGHLVPVEVSAIRLELDGKQLVFGISRNITARKQAEEEKSKLQAQLLQAQKMESVGQLAGGVAHDFNNKLQAILGYAEMSLDHIPADNFAYKSLQEIHKAATSAADITRQLLAFARQQTIEPRVLEINEAVESMLKMLRRLIGEDIRLIWKPTAGLWPVKMDPSQIDQILANLCINARDAITGTGQITVEADMIALDQAQCPPDLVLIAGDFVRLTVTDTGCGMDRSILEKIFEPFFTTKEVGRGTGLGLATVYGIVNQNSGFIHVDSEVGRGTSFTVYLPRYMGPAETQSHAETTPIPKGRGQTILLVEDDMTLLDMGRLLLENLNYQVLTANRPAEALRQVKQHTSTISLLITDVIMPEMNGRELAQRLRTSCPELKVLFMSGYTADIIAHRGVQDNDARFLQKPFSLRALAEKVWSILNQGQ